MVGQEPAFRLPAGADPNPSAILLILLAAAPATAEDKLCVTKQW
jgi:hypothetical protein